MPKAHEYHALRMRVRNAARHYGDALLFSNNGTARIENYHRDLIELTNLHKKVFDAEMALQSAEGELRSICRDELQAREERIAAAREARNAEKSLKQEFKQG